MRRILIVGGASGIGLAIALEMAGREDCEQVYVVDKNPFPDSFRHPRITSFQFDLTASDYSFFQRFSDIDSLMITAGFGRLALFSDISDADIQSYFQVNTVAVTRLLHMFYPRLLSHETFRCGVMVSIAGYLSSPFFSVYGATKAALRSLIESVNVELLKAGSTNQILNVSPGSIKGTRFNAGSDNNLELTTPLARAIIARLEQGNDLFIPDYDTVYRQVLQRYHDDFRAEGLHSYDYKVQSGRINQ